MKISGEKLATLLEKLRALLGERLVTGKMARQTHGQDESYHQAAIPDAVAFVRTTEEVSKILKLCAAYACPLIPFGAGTSLEGQVLATKGGVSLDFSQMNEILQLNPEDMDVTLQAGVTRLQLDQYLRDSGLFFPVDPGADATLGGMAATRASGTNAVRYGTMRENVLGLTVVMADGRVIRTGGRARKSSAGYDLTHLLVGSEGTLGVITELTLRLYGRPESVAVAVCDFMTLEGAVNSTIEIVQYGIPVARIELLDEIQIAAINGYAKMDHPLRPTLFLEFHGTESSVLEQADQVSQIVSENGGSDFKWSIREEEKNRLWKARHEVAYACKALRPGCAMWSTDVCVPVSRLTECILQTRADIDRTGLTAPIVGHVGDGNFHVVMILDSDNIDEVENCRAFNERLLQRALDMNGTVTGEHGIGYGKKAFMHREHGGSVEVMRMIKNTLDPLNILNPGKILPDD